MSLRLASLSVAQGPSVLFGAERLTDGARTGAGGVGWSDKRQGSLRALAVRADSSMLHWRHPRRAAFPAAMTRYWIPGSRVLRSTNHRRRLHDCAHFQPKGQ